MAQATVKTVQFVDPRIEPQPDPLYDYVIGPTQNQYYKIPASGKSNSSLTFNNLTTLGVDRAYLDTFEIELTCQFTFNLAGYINDENAEGGIREATDTEINANHEIFPAPDSFTFQSFPFNTCCDEARVNVNGGAFFSQPLCYVRAKERYMDQKALSECYENVCPIHRPIGQTETGRVYTTTMNSDDSSMMNTPMSDAPMAPYNDITAINGVGFPTRLGAGMYNFMQSETGLGGGFNNSIIHLGKKRDAGGYENWYRDGKTVYLTVTWREPLFVSPFSSRYDANYGRPLYNITSLDFAFNLQNLGNMIRIANLHSKIVPDNDDDNRASVYIKDYKVDIKSAQLCYQVMTIPSILQKPLTTLVPYRRFVPYITDYNQQAGTGGPDASAITTAGANIEIRSGIYTLNEIPTAIWVFCAPTKDCVQMNYEDKYVKPKGAATTELQENRDNTLYKSNWECNKLFAYLRHINITMANTTQILNTAEPHDLYRIAKANGCEDSYYSWSGYDVPWPKYTFATDSNSDNLLPMKGFLGAGSVLRLKPGVDLIVPDIPLIPGANANNMVFQVSADFYVPPHSEANGKYSLWLLFEYVGVAAISPGQCEISMNPLGSGEIMAVSPVMSATSEATEGKLEGTGDMERMKKGVSIVKRIADSGALSKLIRAIGTEQAKKIADYMGDHGFGESGCKRSRGGAVIGKGLNDWV